jgi:hypothetical protein
VGWGFLGLTGLVAGGPTFLGAVIGGWWVSETTEVFCLSLASGTILYIIGELLHLGRQLRNETVVAVGLLLGFFVAVGTDFVLASAMHARPDTQTLLESETSAPIGEEFHRPRHGGYFGDADDLYHYEVVLAAGNRLRLYVNDASNRPLHTEELEGRWTLNPDSPQPATGRFSSSPDGAYLEAVLPPSPGEFLHVEVAVRKGRHWAPMEFVLPRPS